MEYYTATEDGYIKKSIRDGSMEIFEDKDDAEAVRGKLKCELTEVPVVKKETYDRLTEENAKLRELVELVASGDSASDEAKAIMVHTYIYNAKQLLNQLKDKNNDK